MGLTLVPTARANRLAGLAARMESPGLERVSRPVTCRQDFPCSICTPPVAKLGTGSESIVHRSIEKSVWTVHWTDWPWTGTSVRLVSRPLVLMTPPLKMRDVKPWDGCNDCASSRLEI